jgi:hypothetical protein
MATRDPPFRFMDLPVELRLMVYEFLPRTIKHTYIVPAATASNPQPQVELILITKHVPVVILATCREVHAEAKTIVWNIVKRFILDSPPKVIHTSVSNHELEKIFGAVSIERANIQVSPRRRSYKKMLSILTDHKQNDDCKQSRFIHGAEQGHRETSSSKYVNEANGTFARQAAHVLEHRRTTQDGTVMHVVALETRQVSLIQLKLNIYLNRRARHRSALWMMEETGLFTKIHLVGVLVVDDHQDMEVSESKPPVHWTNPVEFGNPDLEFMKREVWVGEWLPSA